MNNSWAMLAQLLQRLPISVRRTLYSVVTAAGAVLAVAQLYGWKHIGPIDMDEALKTYALVSSPTGFLALANSKHQEEGYAGFDPDADYRDHDLASFEGSGGFDAWEETAVQDVDDDGSVDLSTEPSEEPAFN